MVISPPSDSLSSRTESASSPSRNVELFQSTLVKVGDSMYFVTVFIKPAPGSSSTVGVGVGPRRIPSTDPASSSVRAVHAAYDAVDVVNRLPMIDSLERLEAE